MPERRIVKEDPYEVRITGMRIRTVVSCIAAALWPFIYCYRYVIPGQSYSLKIANDFWYLYNCKVYLLDKLSNFQFPLWSPSESAGMPFYSNPFTQAFYIFNIPLTLLYKVLSGYSYHDHQVFTVFGLSVFAVGILMWLRSLHVGLTFALISACLIAVNSKMIEILRFPNAVHTVAWVPWILLGITLALNASRPVKAGVVIFVSAVLMVTAGYPYNAYYSFFLIIPYAAFVFWISRKRPDFGLGESSTLKYTLVIGTALASAFAVCYPYIREITQLFDQIGFRKGDDFEFSTFFKFSLTDTIGSLVFPPAAHIEGWYYFGVAGFLIVSAYVIYSLVNYNENKLRGKTVIVILLWMGTVSYITYGSESYLFRLLWEYFPGFSRLRIIGRMNFILLPAIAYLLAESLRLFFESMYLMPETGRKKKLIQLSAFILVMYGLTLSAQLYFMKNKALQVNTVAYSKSYLPGMNEMSFVIYGAVAVALLLFCLSASALVKKRYAVAKFFLLSVFVLISLDMFNAGIRQWASKPLPSDTERRMIGVDSLNMKSFSTPRDNKQILLSLTPSFSVVGIDEWSFERYKNFLKRFEEESNYDTSMSSADRFSEIMGLNDGQKIFFTSERTHESLSGFFEDMNARRSEATDKYKILNYTGDRLEINVESVSAGKVIFIDNWDKGWKAFVNGTEVPVNIELGTFKSVKIPAGVGKVVFEYSPDFFD
ncbi:MAG: YfhO family protein [Ignavibacteria bacterium]|nr:YfhO family protein [Ignavibacteria bacterium]